MYGGIYDPGLRLCPARVRWSLDGFTQCHCSRKSQRPLAWMFPTNRLPELYSHIISQQLGWLDGCQNFLESLPRHRLRAAWDPIF